MPTVSYAIAPYAKSWYELQLPWDSSSREDRRFGQILGTVLLAFVAPRAVHALVPQAGSLRVPSTLRSGGPASHMRHTGSPAGSRRYGFVSPRQGRWLSGVPAGTVS